MSDMASSSERSDDDRLASISEEGTKKVSETMNHSTSSAGPAAQNDHKDQPEVARDEGAIAEIERFRRMEACLYKHRKEWEVNIGPGKWQVDSFFVQDPKERGHWFDSPEGQSWLTADKQVRGERKYNRPDIFDPAFVGDTNDAWDFSKSSIGKDVYDTTIDWGHRRDRLRKTFEWELDRMFLREELQLKRLEQQKAEEGKKRRERRMAENDTKSGEEGQGDTALPSDSTSIEAGVAWSEWFAFKKTGPSDSKAMNVIDVLIGEPIVDTKIDANRFWFRSSSHRVAKSHDPSTSQKTTDAMDAATSPLPERIRINSDTLLQIFAELLGPVAQNVLELEEMNIVFTRPFKALAWREQDLRDWCLHLEKKFEDLQSGSKAFAALQKSSTSVNNHADAAKGDAQEITDGVEKATLQDSTKSQVDSTETIEQQGERQVHTNNAPDGQASDADNESGNEKHEYEDFEDSDKSLTKSPTALKHLKYLLQFLDATLVAKRNYFNSPQCRKVFFSDLWHLFRPGTEVIGSDGKQAYRVIGVQSARHRIAPPWERWYKPIGRGEKKLEFRITCVYIDFDGANIGPVTKVFDISMFDGQREITSLEVYPIRFHSVRQSEYNETEWHEMENYPVSERYRKRLIGRGARFLNVVRGKHMYYAGSTLDAREEVESPVVIDFETAITTRDAQLKPPQPANLRGYPPPDEEQEVLPADLPWKPKLSSLISIPELDAPGYVECSGECCRDENVHDDQYVDRKQKQEYLESLLPSKEAVDEQPPITVMPRPLKDLRLGPEGNFACSDDELVIMSYRVFGFVLRSRKFAKLDLTHLTEIHDEESIANSNSTSKGGRGQNPTPTKGAFDRLVLEEGHSSMIVSLIAQHFRDKKSTTGKREEFDIVRGKGKGLIILLHGAPGVGKTSTAEGIAEKFKKPLFQITCGDLGTTASEVELALEKNFTLANKWDCILLLDEADVFLTERSKEDFKRNGLVAVFLRLMEYYSGILFLTTNRVGDFDEAFTSRIHVSLYYPALNEEKTGQVFEINMDMIEERFRTKGRAIDIDRMKIAFFAMRYFNDHPDARWNGRQIRNACQTALALAEFEAQGDSIEDTEDRNLVVKLNVKHFEIVRDAYLEFARYMKALFGTSAARKAKESKLRAILVDENNNIVSTQNLGDKRMDKAAFTHASQNHSSRPMGHSPQQSFQQSPDQQYARYQQQQSSTFGAPQPQYQSSQHPASQYTPQYPAQHQNPSSQEWYAQQSRNSSAYVPEPQQGGQFQSSVPHTQQTSPSPNRQQQAQLNPPWLGEEIRNMHAASGQLGDEQSSAGASRFQRT
ncbi:uncharacterized protein CC84DRAFT_1142712 [Paraphaeosphaeria sporulosa]|uniref:AAA+ ATPase domain-containing protein n=1 Tax=Paraphaeosphaeria sporulosa TaxID=1460663 RepID=A0A177CIB5_9PLEO|nr:uncharacterized protein CC84DRAFT_1142712 [Paraphaeosphaeria sporulosa]OAG06722.1 hypothetical protein CC84DRAFT_1142712 [Paraphaeosphaeria sporulosa]